MSANSGMGSVGYWVRVVGRDRRDGIEQKLGIQDTDGCCAADRVGVVPAPDSDGRSVWNGADGLNCHGLLAWTVVIRPSRQVEVGVLTQSAVPLRGLIADHASHPRGRTIRAQVGCLH